jgi:hypothetical protein
MRSVRRHQRAAHWPALAAAPRAGLAFLSKIPSLFLVHSAAVRAARPFAELLIRRLSGRAVQLL